MVDLRQKTITGVMWSGIDSFAEQLVHFIVGIVMARVIAPREYGLIGMITVFYCDFQFFHFKWTWKCID